MRDRHGAIAFAPGLRVGRRVCLNARKYGILSRPLGDTLVILPPLAIRAPEVRQLADGLVRAMRDTLREPDVQRAIRSAERA